MYGKIATGASGLSASILPVTGMSVLGFALAGVTFIFVGVALAGLLPRRLRRRSR
jgi:hypothetical protein